MAYTLYSYWRSSCSWRVRAALALKGIPYTYAPIHLVREGGEQHQDAFRELNPMRQVPALVLDDGRVLAQSVAILEYLEEVHPEPPLLPTDPVARARTRQLVEAVNAGIQPIQNLGVMQELTRRFGTDRPANAAWSRAFIARGFEGLERLMAATAGRHAVGDEVTLADVLLVPQMYNARRFSVDLSPLPTLTRVDEAARALEAFQVSAPEAQPDAQV